MKIYSEYFSTEFDTGELDRKYGTVEHANKTLWLVDQAACDNYGTDGGVRYYANAIDGDGNTYQIAWDTTEGWDLAEERARLEAESCLDDGERERLTKLQDMVLPDVSDESNACNWANPVKVTLL